MLNFPKTGSSFAREILKELYARRRYRGRHLLEKLRIVRSSVYDLKMPKIDETIDYRIQDQHGTYRQIPDEHRHKRIVTITRNPLSRYLSTYHFRWWEQHPPAEKRTILERYPHFPNLSFGEYYDMMHVFGRANRLRGIEPKTDIGLYTIQFIQFYFKNPEKVLASLDDSYIERGLFREDMGENIRFIHQENLNTELKQFLSEIGFNADELTIVDKAKRINVTKGMADSARPQHDVADREIVQAILRRDRLLFQLFPEYLPNNAE